MQRIVALLIGWIFCFAASAGENRPNFLFLVGEDLGPHLGCYGDKHAVTPHLDKLASQGARFNRCFTHAPVCAPSRSGLITGMYPTTIGSHHMRSKLKVPPPTFTSLLRKAGYFVAWPGKTDFNFDIPKDAFDSTKKWTDREPGKPFFAFYNVLETHESRIRQDEEHYRKDTAKLTPEQRHDPAKMPVPPYYPDAPEVRKNIATYYDLGTAVDYTIGEILAELEARGEADNTIVIFWGDHGWGMPRGKRWCYDSGTRVPLLVRWPKNIPPGSVREDLVAVIDFAPTILALAGVDVPKEMQGQIFLGPKQAPERQYAFSCRDRMDETYDRIRSVRDKRFRYLRNFEPQLPYAQHIAYMDEMPTMQVWRKWNEEGKLHGPQKLFFAATKPAEELYDLDSDPHEINNLAAVPEHQDKLKELRAALDKWIAGTKDLGAVPETELIKQGLVEDVLVKYKERTEPGFKAK